MKIIERTNDCVTIELNPQDLIYVIAGLKFEKFAHAQPATIKEMRYIENMISIIEEVEKQPC